MQQYRSVEARIAVSKLQLVIAAAMWGNCTTWLLRSTKQRAGHS